MGVTWPNGHKFAFTVVDDTDFCTIAKVKPVYDLLAGLRLKTTKTTWMFPGEGPPVNGGATCAEPEYVEWLWSLRDHGFEIALHNASPCTSPRENTRLGLTRFRELFHTEKILFCNHVHCRENIYWGAARVAGWRRVLYNLATLRKKTDISRGHVDGDPLFWGDLCQQSVQYVRNFVFDELDALALCPEQPYHDPHKPYVNFWFTSADGATLKRFLANFTAEKLQRLEQSGGLCIAYVHFGSGFAEHGKVDPGFRKRVEYLASLNGWFVPASQVLDYLRQGAGTRERVIAPKRLRELETKWLFDKIRKGTT